MYDPQISFIPGVVWKFGDNCDTGQIIPGRYVPLSDPYELATHLFEDVAPDFRAQITPGDIIVAGKNFGAGSSREHAPKSIKFAGIAAVVSDSRYTAENVGVDTPPDRKGGLPGRFLQNESGQYTGDLP